jgi:ribonuclease-3
MDKKRLEILHDLEGKITYRFSDINLLSTALTHRSYVNENQQQAVSDNERMEFLGDSVLGLCVSDLIIKRYVNSPEGTLTQVRAALVNEKHLAQLARNLQIGDCLLLGRGEENSESRDKDSFLANAFEAVIAAVYLDSGFEEVKNIIMKLIEPLLADDNPSSDYFDYKTALQELCQKKYKSTPLYMITGSTGPDHDKNFEVKVVIVNKLTETGTGKSKKEAEKQAARKALETLQDEEN